jgi:tetratricopeptide (TPR) repeat protein
MTEQDVFDAVFREFKKGVSKQLGEGDHEAHYDLGIAYKEMGLVSDAVAEFRTASHAPARRVDALHMLGVCLVDAGRAAEAVPEFEAALTAPGMSPDQTLAVRFELGRAFEAMGEIARARETWQAVAAVDPGFCEVEERLAALGQEKADAEPEADGELESFRDLFDEDGSEPAEPAAKAEPHESFTDLFDDDAEPAELEPEAEPEPAPPPRPAARRPQPPPPRAAREEAESPKGPRRKKKISFV